MSRIVERFESVCREKTDITAVVYREGRNVHRRSFSQLYEDVRCMRAHLIRSGAKQGDRILAFAASSYKLCVFMLASLQTGASVMYVDIHARQDSLRSVFADYKPDMVLVSDTTKHIRFLFREINRIKQVINIDKASRNAVDAPDISDIPEDMPALLTMTTGSTGRPKIAVRSHLDLMQQLQLINANIDAEGHQTVLTTSFIYIFANILNGYTTVMPQLNIGRWSAKKLNRVLSLFSGENVTMMITSPDLCLKAENIFPQLETLYFGGAILNLNEAQRIREKFPCRCIVIYGSTECSIIATSELDEFIATLRAERRSILGKAVNGVRVRLSDNGEILVTSEALLGSYLINDPSTKETDESGVLWHHTNDIAAEENGVLYFLGKSGRTVEISGKRVYSNCLEQQIVVRFPSLRKCAVLEHSGKQWVVLQRGDSPDTAAVAEFVRTLGMTAPELRIIKSIPCDVKHHTKIDYNKLKEQLK